MEGLEPADEVKALFRRYVDGELTSGQLDESLDRYFDAESGSIPLPGN